MTVVMGVQVDRAGGPAAALLATDRMLGTFGGEGPLLDYSKMIPLRDGWAVSYGTAYLGEWMRPLAGLRFEDLQAQFDRFEGLFGLELDHLWGEHASDQGCGCPRGIMAIGGSADRLTLATVDSADNTSDELQFILPGDVSEEAGMPHVRRLAVALGNCADVAEMLRALSEAFLTFRDLSDFVGGDLEVGVIQRVAGRLVSNRIVAPPEELRLATAARLSAWLTPPPRVPIALRVGGLVRSVRLGVLEALGIRIRLGDTIVRATLP